MRAQDGANAASHINNWTWRGEVNAWSMNPAWDTHNDKGTGNHAVICHGTTGAMTNHTYAIYGHDPLQPGAVSAGQTWPEGGGGSLIEPGNDTGGPISNFTIYAKAANMLMTPNGSGNPGSTGTGQTAGNVLNFWGNISLDAFVLPWIEGANCTGAMVHGAPGTWHPGVPAISVTHGRGTTMNQFTGGGNQSQKYMSGFGIVYNDCT